jgi:Reverse transcriptase (RNA-dependent DNA polymerase)
MRTDAPTISVEVLRMIVSIAVENQWRIGSLDVKAAYLQATGFNRIIYVRPPKEDEDRNNLCKIEKPAHGLADSGRLWFLTAFRALEFYGLRSCPYDKTVFASKNSLLVVTTQVENILFTGTHSEMMLFTDYMKAQFQLSELEYDNFCGYRTKFPRDKHGIRMSQRAKYWNYYSSLFRREKAHARGACHPGRTSLIHVHSWIYSVRWPCDLADSSENGRRPFECLAKLKC